MATHPHKANAPAGSDHDRHDRLDGSHAVGHSTTIGLPFKAFGAFAPMIHSAPVLAFKGHAFTVIPCPSCGAGIKWDGSPVAFLCGGCGGTVDGKALEGQ